MKLLLLILTIFLFACGPSQEEKENIAIIACNIMGETKNIDAAFRIREINNAREQIGAPPFLGSDKQILESFQYELCEDLVLDDNYQEKLSAQISLEEERVRKERELAEKAEAEARAKLERDRLAKIELYKKNYGEILSESDIALLDSALDITELNKNGDESLILQVGAFKSINDAEMQKVELLLLDLPARVKKRVLDNKEVWYTVDLGPYSDISKMRRVRSQLEKHDFSFLILRE